MLQSLRVSKTERALLETMREIRFGEIYGLELLDEPLSEVVSVTKEQRRFIEAIREGMSKIDILLVHNGDPTLAEVDTKIKGFRCRKKYKFFNPD